MKERLLDELKCYPVFSVRDIANILNLGRNYAYQVAFRMKKAGAIFEIEKGKYSIEDDPFLIASWIIWPSYISGYAALSYHKMTDQLPFTIHVVTTRKRKKKIIIYMNTRIEFIRMKKSAFFGFQRIVQNKREMFIAEPEKAILDAIAAKKMSFEEAVDIVKTNRKISRKKLFSYAGAFKGIAKKLKKMVG